MNSISNIWKHPKTSATGLLIAVITIASTLSQQGIALGHAGTGTVVALAGGLATALLGLLARDPSANSVAAPGSAQPAPDSGSGSTVRLGVWALIALLLSATMTVGCSGTSVAENIVNWTPALQSAVAAVNSTAGVLDPAAAPIFTAATAGFDAASNTLVAQAKAYLANPTAGILAQLQTAVVTFQQQVNASLLAAAKITSPASQQKALADINAVATVVNSILALVESISSKAAVARMAAQSTIKLAAVRPYLDEESAVATVAAHYSEPVQVARLQVAQAEYSAAGAGF